jgi:hypothetical protein
MSLPQLLLLLIQMFLLLLLLLLRVGVGVRVMARKRAGSCEEGGFATEQLRPLNAWKLEVEACEF